MQKLTTKQTDDEFRGHTRLLEIERRDDVILFPEALVTRALFSNVIQIPRR